MVWMCNTGLLGPVAANPHSSTTGLLLKGETSKPLPASSHHFAYTDGVGHGQDRCLYPQGGITNVRGVVTTSPETVWRLP